MKKVSDKNILKDKWEASYTRGENAVFYPKEEIVKFLNRFVRKKTDHDKFRDIIDFSQEIKGLDYGCGTGRQTILLKEFGINAYGVDISQEAIERAKKLAAALGYKQMGRNFLIVDGFKIPFKNDFFDLTIASGVLDSLSFEIAKQIMKEIDRITKGLVFVSLISGDDYKHDKDFHGEELMRTQHENGTIQSYYSWEKIQTLVQGTRFKVNWCRLITEESVVSKYKSGRYFLVLKKDH